MRELTETHLTRDVLHVVDPICLCARLGWTPFLRCPIVSPTNSHSATHIHKPSLHGHVNMHNYFNLHKDVMDKKKSVMTHNYLFMENGAFARSGHTPHRRKLEKHYSLNWKEKREKTMKLYNLMILDRTSENTKLCKYR